MAAAQGIGNYPITGDSGSDGFGKAHGANPRTPGESRYGNSGINASQLRSGNVPVQFKAAKAETTVTRQNQSKCTSPVILKDSSRLDSHSGGVVDSVPTTAVRAPRLPYLALAAVCFFWGTTYLGIRMSLETFPPLILVSARYIVSGGLIVLYAALRGKPLPRGRELLAACFSGLLVLGIGNGALVFAETAIPSGIAGLIISMSPFWMVAAEALLPGGEGLHGPTIGAMTVGLAGAGVLFAADPGPGGVGGGLLFGFLILQIGMAAWAFGSIYQRRRNGGRAHPIVAGGVQQLAAGLILAPFAAAIPQHAIHWSTRGVCAILYLVVFGSIVGYSAYIYALDRLPVAIASVYPYVNSIVAVLLGWLFYREPFGWLESLSMAIIFTSVALVKKYSRKPG